MAERFFAAISTINHYPEVTSGYPSFRVNPIGFGHNPAGFLIHHDQLGPRLSSAVKRATRNGHSLNFWEKKCAFDWRYNPKTNKWRIEIVR
jgi:hypothetical protein